MVIPGGQVYQAQSRIQLNCWQLQICKLFINLEVLLNFQISKKLRHPKFPNLLQSTIYILIANFVLLQLNRIFQIQCVTTYWPLSIDLVSNYIVTPITNYFRYEAIWWANFWPQTFEVFMMMKIHLGPSTSAVV